MKANELRIGNYVYDRGNKLLKIEGWENESKVFQSSGYYNLPEPIGQLPFHPLTEDVEFLKPILLTEEWLLKFGFVEQNFKPDLNREWFKTFEIEETCYQFSLDFYPEKTETIFGYDIGYGHNDIELKYVHELQNLYFSLFGIELQIKNQNPNKPSVITT